MNEYSRFNILIIGDSCEDIFVYGNVARLAPEAPIPIINPLYEKRTGGMALNVKNNIIAIGSKCDLITNQEYLIKKRFVDERTNHLILRVDENDSVARISQDIINKINHNIYNDKYYDCIVISDYCKGFLSEKDIEYIANNNKNIFLDTKKILGNWCNNVSFIKINQTEYETTLHTINKLNIHDKLIITKSQEGCVFQNNLYPVEKVNIKDVSGAGDSFLAGLACEYMKTLDIEKAIHFAQDCATIVVQKKGVCTI